MKYLKYILFFSATILSIGLMVLIFGNNFNNRNIPPITKNQNISCSFEGNNSDNIRIKKGAISNSRTNKFNTDSILWVAKKYIGTPYKMGGLGFDGMDCSGLVKSVFREAGITLPHNSNELAKQGILITKVDYIKKGDILLFHTEWNNESSINHAGIYLGNGYFIHATTSLGTIISKLNDPSYKNSFICATRIILPQPIDCYAGN